MFATRMKLKWRICMVCVLVVLCTALTLYPLYGSTAPLDAKLRVQREHMSWMRKDLDASNYRSRSNVSRSLVPEDPRPLEPGEAPGLAEELQQAPDIDLLYADSSEKFSDDSVLKFIMNRLLVDDTFRSARNLSKLIHAADLLRKDIDIFKQQVNSSSFVVGNGLQPSLGTTLPPIGELHSKELAAIKTAFSKTKKTARRKKATKGHTYYRSLLGLKKLTSWQRFHNSITQDELYQKQDEPIIDELLHDLVNQPIVKAVEKEDGTQLKVMLTFANGGKAIFKPMKFPREKSEAWPNHYYFSDFERHFSEIASFHLDRIFGFRRVPPVAGRYVNINELEKLANPKFKKTFYTSPIGNKCFFGTCDYYCVSGHAVCGSPNLIEGAVIAYLPSSTIVDREELENPWIRSYSKRHKADWETDNTWCKKVKKQDPWNRSRLLLDMIDVHIFDFLTGNMDRHHVETFSEYNNDTFPINLDNGRGFGKSAHDELSILTPLDHCCMVRKSTLARLLEFYEGPVSLSAAMRSSLSRDAASPVLLEPHLYALDRRVVTVLHHVADCIAKNRLPYLNTVVIDDGF